MHKSLCQLSQEFFTPTRFKQERDTTESLKDIFYFDIKWVLFIRLMTLNCLKLGTAVTFMKYLASVTSLIFLLKTLIWNKIMFPASNMLNFAELMKNELIKSTSKKNLSIFLFLSDLLLLLVKTLRAYN